MYPLCLNLLKEYYNVSTETIQSHAFYIIEKKVFIIDFELVYLSGLHHVIEL